MLCEVALIRCVAPSKAAGDHVMDQGLQGLCFNS